MQLNQEKRPAYDQKLSDDMALHVGNMIIYMFPLAIRGESVNAERRSYLQSDKRQLPQLSPSDVP